MQIAVLEKKTKRDRLIVMDNVSGLDEESKKLKIFNSLTSIQLYLHTIYPEKSIWRMILSKRNIFNIFPAKCSFRKCAKNFRCLQSKNKKVCLSICTLDQ